MESIELQTFLAVAENQSFSLAAEQLHKTQPAISKRINNLETKLGYKLFHRISKQIYLTDAGTALLPLAKRLIINIEDVHRTLNNLSSEIKGHLKIATSHHIGLHRLPPILKQFSKSYPKVMIDIQFVDSEVAYELIIQGKVELGIVTLAPESHTPYHQLTSNAIWNDPLVIACAKDHPATIHSNKKNASTELNILTKHPAILPSDNTFTRQLINEIFKNKNEQLNVSMETNYMETIKMMISIGLGWGILPETMVDEELFIIKNKHININRTLGRVQHKNRILSRAAEALINILNQNASSPDLEYSSAE